ncbi:hypothetical protein KPL70_004088 [Citrus sinensis]|uniref:HMA domain-containing protein n=3 Tax=Citrus TaxID=2706 RepID=A0A2H5PS29_CITUN|nr:hypothetical protein KPL70_004088 [Citrus sinensis]GAY55152.1 hypothetical protein CUMW_162190 [Citrus unshiu]
MDPMMPLANVYKLSSQYEESYTKFSSAHSEPQKGSINIKYQPMRLSIPNKELTKAKATKLTIFSQRAGFLFASSSPSKQLKPMTQKVVIKLTLEGHKSRSKALKIAVGVSGVESASLKGDDKSQIEVTGDGMDPVLLTSLLRKKVGYAELVSVGPAGEKKDENKPKNPEVKPQPPQYLPPYYGGWVPHYDYHVVSADRYADPCSIM